MAVFELSPFPKLHNSDADGWVDMLVKIAGLPKQTESVEEKDTFTLPVETAFALVSVSEHPFELVVIKRTV